MITLQQGTIYMGTAAPASGGGGSGDAVWGSITGTLSSQIDLQTALSAKQDTLTAGSNITISGNTISATDTTYSDFVGTDGSDNGTAGLVPAPTSSDVDKYLKSDGTWGEVAATLSYDDMTINENSSHDLQAIGVIDARSETPYRTWIGDEIQWEEGTVTKTWYEWGTNVTLSWTEETSGFNIALNAIARSYDQCVAVGASGLIISTTDGGESWTQETSGINQNLNGITYDDNFNEYIAVGNNGTILASQDGSYWEQRTGDNILSTDSYFGVATNQNVIVVVGSTFDNDLSEIVPVILSSNDGGFTWEREVINNDSYFYNNILYDITLGKDGIFVAVGGDLNETQGFIISLNDAGQWNESLDQPNNNVFKSVAYMEYSQGYVAVGNAGLVNFSSDGYAWNPTSSGINQNLLGVTAVDGKFVAFGEGGVIISSFNGTSWTQDTSGVNTALNGGEFDGSNGKFIIVGNSGKVLSAQYEYNYVDTAERYPTTNSIVYEAYPDELISEYTISSVTSNTITLSNDVTYTYFMQRELLEYPVDHIDWISYIPGVGIKLGDLDIANYTEYTAGDNITITDGEISATDTTYTAGTGIDITNDEISTVDMQTTTNLVTSVSASSTDAQYPSAKLFYDTVGDIETLLHNLNSGS